MTNHIVLWAKQTESTWRSHREILGDLLVLIWNYSGLFATYLTILMQCQVFCWPLLTINASSKGLAITLTGRKTFSFGRYGVIRHEPTRRCGTRPEVAYNRTKCPLDFLFLTTVSGGGMFGAGH